MAKAWRPVEHPSSAPATALVEPVRKMRYFVMADLSAPREPVTFVVNTEWTEPELVHEGLEIDANP